MSSWADFTAAAPGLAAAIEERLAASRYALVGTIRADGFPRISGIVARVEGGELWLSTKAGSAIAGDLRREPRCSLHSGPVHGGQPRRDVKMQGRAVEEPGEGGLTRFRVDVVDASTIRLGDPPDHHVLETWREGERGSQIAHR